MNAIVVKHVSYGPMLSSDAHNLYAYDYEFGNSIDGRFPKQTFFLLFDVTKPKPCFNIG